MVGSLFYLAANIFVGIIYGTIATFQIERSVLLRELASRQYGLAAYFMVKNIIEFPIMIMFPLLTQLVVFWGAPYTNQPNEFWAFYLPLFLIAQCSVGFGVMVSASCKSLETASELSNLVNLPAMFFGGLFSNGTSIVTGVKWIQYLSPIRYCFECLVRANYGDTPDGDIIYNLFGLNWGYWWCIAGLAVLVVVTRILSWVILKYNVKYFA
jgi:ABC-type transport system involved in multi-copper enzyme maturation permease subunit